MHQLFKVSQREEKGKGRELVRTYSRLLLLLFSSTSSSSSTNINNNNDYYSRVERERILPPMDLALSLARSIDPSSLPVFLSLARSVLPRSSFFSLSLSLSLFFGSPFPLSLSLTPPPPVVVVVVVLLYTSPIFLLSCSPPSGVRASCPLLISPH